MTIYTKPAMDAGQHVALMQNRGLGISDTQAAEHAISTIGYYRLSAYMLPFQQPGGSHLFQSGVDLDRILDLYEFDRELRLLIMDGIERVEVAVRSQLNTQLAMQHGPHWYLDRSLFRRDYHHAKLIDDIKKECRRSKELFVAHYQSSYTSPALPPTWMVTELLTLGQLSKLYAGLSSQRDKKLIAQELGVPAKVLLSWLQSLTYVRNLCAHHARLWNRELANAPTLPRSAGQDWIRSPIQLAVSGVNPAKRMYVVFALSERLLKVIDPVSGWRNSLHDLMKRYPTVNHGYMGMPSTWDDDPFWGF